MRAVFCYAREDDDRWKEGEESLRTGEGLVWREGEGGQESMSVSEGGRFVKTRWKLGGPLDDLEASRSAGVEGREPAREAARGPDRTRERGRRRGLRRSGGERVGSI